VSARPFLEAFDVIERTRAALTVAITQAQLRLSRLEGRCSREEAARLYAVFDAAVDAVQEIARMQRSLPCSTATSQSGVAPRSRRDQ
jgi:hypothetical protein